MFLVAAIPPLWFRVMDPRLLEHTQRDPQRIHFDPKRRQALCERYQLEATPDVEPAHLRSVAA
jgi:alkane 1-monooxygenase